MLEFILNTMTNARFPFKDRSNAPADWKGSWILGLTSRAENKGFSRKHHLFSVVSGNYAKTVI